MDYSEEVGGLNNYSLQYNYQGLQFFLKIKI
jgi:hypothetical protein